MLSTDTLEIMMQKQLELQQRLGYDLKNDILWNVDFIKLNYIAVSVELAEMLQEIPFKPWKKSAVLNKENFKKELIDVYHFILNLTIASGMTVKELQDAYLEKNKENHDRQERGY